MANDEVKAYAKQAGVRLWEVAERLHITDVTLSKKLRYELDPEYKSRIIKLVDKIAKEKQSQQ